MASHTGLKQASRLVQGNKAFFVLSKPQVSSSRCTVLSSSVASFSKHPETYRHHVLQQKRHLSWWGSGSSDQSSTSLPPNSPSNLNVSEPAGFQNTITPDRSIKASNNLSSSEAGSETPQAHIRLEPEFIEHAQRSITEPHFSETPLSPDNLEDIPERIGYLKEVCGLDYGWGPSSVVQFLLEQIHINAGLSWTASIFLLGFVIRGMMFPLLVRSAKESQKLRDAKKFTDPIMAEYNTAKSRQDNAKMQDAMRRMMVVRKEFGVSMWKAFLPPLVQIPFGFGCWRILRGAATLPIPGFVTESWLWTSDLSFSDPFFITPALSSILIWATIKTNSRANASNQSANLMAILQKAMPALSLVFMSFQPGAVQLYFLSSSVAGYLSSVILVHPSVRMYFKMPPLPTTPGSNTSFLSSKPKPEPAPTSPSNVPSHSPPAGGLNRKRMAARTQEAKDSVQFTSQEAAKNNKSAIDKGVDYAKSQYSDLKGSFTKVGEQLGLAGKTEEWKKNAQKDKIEEYEARVKEKLDQRRRERNSRYAGPK